MMLTDVVIANRSYTRLRIAEQETVDEIALKVMKQDCPDFLLPIRTMEIDGEREIRYEQQEGVRLCYSSMKMGRKEFLALLGNLLLPFRICDDWFLDYHNILLDANYVLLGRNDHTVRYIYVPVAEYARKDTEIVDFFSDLILKADIQDDSRICIELLRALKGDNSNLMTLLDYVTREDSAPAQRREQEAQAQGGAPEKSFPDMREAISHSVQAIQRAVTVQDQEPVDRKAQDSGPAARPGQSTEEFGKQDVQGQLVGSLFDEDPEPEKKKSKGKPHKSGKVSNKEKPSKSGGLLDIFKGKAKGGEGHKEPVPRESAHGAQEVSPARPSFQDGAAHMAGGMSDDVTELFSEEQGSDGGMLRLRLVEIDMRQGFATVGRRDKNNQAQSDYSFDASLSFISRRHFRVEREGDHWIIIDLGSGNGTFVNGEALLPNMRHPLFPGDTVMISANRRLTYRVC